MLDAYEQSRQSGRNGVPFAPTPEAVNATATIATIFDTNMVQIGGESYADGLRKSVTIMGEGSSWRSPLLYHLTALAYELTTHRQAQLPFSSQS